MKILGACLVAAACAGIGLCRVRRLTDSERLWQDWVRLLAVLYTELRYTARPVQEILAALNPKDYGMLGWLSPYDATTCSLYPSGLCEEEESFAREFFPFLGISDLAGQLAHIEQFTERAKVLLAQSGERRQRLSGVYVSTAVCLGISAGVMML